ncbi:MAG TPA: hypothetical protein VEH86_02085 [Candidatus Acidoferrum sp.]|nr:hypothetical protein [Candidatus Acidoferrum sp.]
MQSKKEREKTGREKLGHIIETCRSVEGRSLDPFLIDVKENIGTIKEYFPNWTIAEDLCLDAETIHHLASVIKLQGEWVKHRSTSLYTDPFLLEEKLRSLSKEEIIETFLESWHPIIELEQVSIQSLAEATAYWINLLPIKERWKEKPPGEVQMGSASREELLREKILQDKAFSEELTDFWHELKRCAQSIGQNSKIPYWSFIGRETYEETVQRAFMTSFLVTYGYATLEIHSLEEEIFIKPREDPETKIGKSQLVSIPISVSVEEWKKWKRETSP